MTENNVNLHFMNQEKITKNIFQDIFKNNWSEEFIFDTINSKNYTYEEFFELILKIKKNLETYNIKAGENVCSILKNSIELIALFFAGILLKITIICIDPSRGSDEIKEMYSMKKSKLCLVNEEFHYSFVNNQIKINKLLDSDKIRHTTINDLVEFQNLDYDREFTITFTSGSTGKPKGVIHNLKNYVTSSILFNKRFNFSKNDRFYHNLPLSYIGGILNLLFLPFTSGSKIILSEQFDISKVSNFWDIPKKYLVNVFWFTPTEISLLLKLDRGNVGIEYCQNKNIIGLVGTASLREDIKIGFEQRYELKLFESYCLSETFFVSTNYEENDKSNHVGPLLDNVKVSFSDDNEILLDTPSMFLGYVGLSNDDFFDDNGFYLSGDLGDIKNNFLKISGRKKDLIIKGGMNISPKRIEDFIINLKMLDELTILGIDDYYMGEKIVCFYTDNKLEINNEMKIINDKIVEKLGAYFKIDEFFKLDELPKTPSGKINKPLIRKKYSNLKNN